MASGMPSSRRHSSTTRGPVAVGDLEVRGHRQGTIQEQPHRLVVRWRRSPAPRSSGTDERRHREDLLALDPEHVPAGRPAPAAPGPRPAACSPARRRRRAGARSCPPRPAATGARATPRPQPPPRPPTAPAVPAGRGRREMAWGTSGPSRSPPRFTSQTPSGYSSATSSARELQRQPGFPDAADAGQGQHPAGAPAAAEPRSARCRRPTKLVSSAGRAPPPAAVASSSPCRTPAAHTRDSHRVDAIPGPG